jgi:hypothetical protein
VLNDACRSQLQCFSKICTTGYSLICDDIFCHNHIFQTTCQTCLSHLCTTPAEARVKRLEWAYHLAVYKNVWKIFGCRVPDLICRHVGLSALSTDLLVSHVLRGSDNCYEKLQRLRSHLIIATSTAGKVGSQLTVLLLLLRHMPRDGSTRLPHLRRTDNDIGSMWSIETKHRQE